MRSLAFAVVGLGGTLSDFALQASSAHAYTIDEMIVYVECKSPEDQAPRKGSGVIIDPQGYLLTAKHVVFGDSASLPEGTTCEGALGHAGRPKQELTFKDHSDRYDAAILKMPPPNTGDYQAAKYCELTDDLQRQLIFATGFPLETKTNVPSSRVGVISTPEADDEGLIETDSATTEGMSGGMVTLGNSGNLVGIVAGVKTGWTGLPDHYAVLAAQRLAQEFGQWGLAQTPCQVAQSRISSCRVCFRQAGDAGCLGSEASCSAWSDAPEVSPEQPTSDSGWSGAVRVDAGVPGTAQVCDLQWKVECR